MENETGEGAAWTDSHCHLTMDDFARDLDQVLARAATEGVPRVLCVGTRPEDWGPSADLARSRSFRATAGLHPHEASRLSPDLLARLGDALHDPSVAAVGEVGLDYHYDFAPPQDQREAFAAQAALAARRGLPLVIHSRLAFEDTLAVLREVARETGGVLHCFAYGRREAEAFLDLGFYISFSGLVTFPKAPEIREAAAAVPLDRLLVETDGPYLAPVPFRGKRCEPWHTAVTGRFLAGLLGMEAGKLAEITSANAERLFGLWPKGAISY
jgi:TatD DNase family protein